MTDIVLYNPSDTIIVTFDWNADLATGITVTSVVHTVPAPLTKISEATNAGAGQSQVKFSGGVHGEIYQILGAATLSEGEVLNRAVPVRCWQS